MQPSLVAPATLPKPLRWRLVLPVKGFDDRQACQLGFLRWLVERGHLDGQVDGRAVLQSVAPQNSAHPR